MFAVQKFSNKMQQHEALTSANTNRVYIENNFFNYVKLRFP
jgi:hypothetical protein